MDRRAWMVTVHGVAELDRTERLSMQARKGDGPSQGSFLMIAATSPGHDFHMQTNKSQARTPAISFI